MKFFKALPLFPLPNVVLFPRAVLPLHIFEERYKTMTADALDGRRMVAMTLLRPGWERDYYSRPPVDPVVCVGRILNHEMLEDGKYNFVLQGAFRARIVQEYCDLPYRTADLEQLIEQPVDEIVLGDQREKMAQLLRTDFATFLPGAQQFLQLLASPLSTAEIADLVAFHLLDDVLLKQSLLAECDVLKRVIEIVSAVGKIQRPMASFQPKSPKDPSWN